MSDNGDIACDHYNRFWDDIALLQGYLDGVFAPGRASWPDALAAAHHLLLSHGRATEAIRRLVPGARIGLALDCRPSSPASDSVEDIAANRHFDGFRNRWFFDPVFGKGYPTDILDAYRSRGRFEGDLPGFVLDDDLEVISTPVDFLGVNYYTSLAISAGADESEDTGVAAGPTPPEGYTEMGWPITPDALGDFLRRLDRDTGRWYADVIARREHA